MVRPLIFLDVDGPLITLHARAAAGRRARRPARQRPFVWLDDEITDADRRWVAVHHANKALLHRVDPYVGLTDSDFSLVRRWLAQRPDQVLYLRA